VSATAQTTAHTVHPGYGKPCGDDEEATWGAAHVTPPPPSSSSARNCTRTHIGVSGGGLEPGRAKATSRMAGLAVITLGGLPASACTTRPSVPVASNCALQPANPPKRDLSWAAFTRAGRNRWEIGLAPPHSTRCTVEQRRTQVQHCRAARTLPTRSRSNLTPRFFAGIPCPLGNFRVQHRRRRPCPRKVAR
jgi:hypothetical protein